MRLALILLLATVASAQGSSLRRKLTDISADAMGRVAIACSVPGTVLDCDVNAATKPPMQSVFKLPLALTALHLVEQNRFSLDRSIRFLPSDRILPHTYSPLQDKYPEANVDIPLRELLRMAISLSDNAAADVVLRTIGGPAVVESYVQAIGVRGFHIEDNEAALHRDVTAQYRNWFQPQGAVQLLRLLVDRPPLTPEHMGLILKWMSDTPRGVNRIKALLPTGTAVMHKPGSSGTDGGIAHATNDIGLVLLPDGRYLAIAVFLTDSKADDAARDSVIARIAKAVYDAAIMSSKLGH